MACLTEFLSPRLKVSPHDFGWQILLSLVLIYVVSLFILLHIILVRVVWWQFVFSHFLVLKFSCFRGFGFQGIKVLKFQQHCWNIGIDRDEDSDLID